MFKYLLMLSRRNISFFDSWMSLIILISVSAILSFIFYSFTLEDAQITYRYALRLSEGYQYGMWNRDGIPVEGTTTLLWTILLSLFGPKIESIAHSSKIFGLISFLFLVVVLWMITRRLKTAVNIKDLPVEQEYLAKAFGYTTIFISFNLPMA